jgi:hypothetical protein
LGLEGELDLARGGHVLRIRRPFGVSWQGRVLRAVRA